MLRPLPPQGLIDEERTGVALRDLRGRRLVWLRGFAVSPPETAIAFGYLSTRLPTPLLHGPHGWYRLDTARHMLIPSRGDRVSLTSGTIVVAHAGPTFTVERRDHVLIRGLAPTFQIVSQRLVQAGSTLLDVEKGRRWKLPPRCLFAGFRERTLVLACGIAHGAEGAAPMILEQMAPGRTARQITQRLAQLIPDVAALSPDGAWVAVEGFTGCAASYVYVAPAGGGRARLVYGKTPTDPFSSNYSTLLGWSADGRLVVLLEPPHCDEPRPPRPPTGVFLVDPRTLARTFVTRNATAMWSR
ncbi:MAG TPA: hypothetical protein VF101_15160 [Gaiellaceae bacterium]